MTDLIDNDADRLVRSWNGQKKPHFVYRSFTRREPGKYNTPGLIHHAMVWSTSGFFMVWHAPNGIDLNKKLTKQVLAVTGNEGAYVPPGTSVDFQGLQQELKKMKFEHLSKRSWLWEEASREDDESGY